MSYALAFVGISVLIVLHELGHLAAAKAVGMRVERFSLFFGPMVLKGRLGETEYGVGVIPLGGYAKISGMSPEEDLPPEVVPRAYCNQPVWKRIFVVSAGPAVNILVAFVLVWGVVIGAGQGVVNTQRQPVLVVKSVERASPAAGTLQPGDQFVGINGRSVTETALISAITDDRCAGRLVNGCRAAKPVSIDVIRHGRRLTLSATPTYNAHYRRMLLGFEFGQKIAPVGALTAASRSGHFMWQVTSLTVSTVARIFEPKERKQLHSFVAIVAYTQQSFALGTSVALQLLALVSLALGIINLFPFLPLDGGHIFWALVEKVRGRRVPLAVMERASWVGVALICMLFAVGLSNDITDIANNTLTLSR